MTCMTKRPSNHLQTLQARKGKVNFYIWSTCTGICVQDVKFSTPANKSETFTAVPAVRLTGVQDLFAVRMRAGMM